MKKSLLFGAVLVLSAPFMAYAADISKEEKALQEHVEFMRGEKSFYREKAKKGAKIGAAAGAVMLGGVAITHPKYMESGIQEEAKRKGYSKPMQSFAGVPKGVTVGALGGAIIGSMWSIPIAQGLQWWQRRKIDGAVNEHLDVSFKTMTKLQAMLVVAAYKRNVPLMKVLINRLPDFVNQKGVWQALTELFMNKKPTSARVKELKKLIQEG